MISIVGIFLRLQTDLSCHFAPWSTQILVSSSKYVDPIYGNNVVRTSTSTWSQFCFPLIFTALWTVEMGGLLCSSRNPQIHVIRAA